MEKRLGVLAVLLTDKSAVPRLNTILSDHSDAIIGRQGIPIRGRGIHIISLIVEGTTDEIGALSGKIGRLQGAEVKSVLTKYREELHEHINA